MIAATNIAIDGDNAWAIDDKDRWWHVNLDRPCDTCDGVGWLTWKSLTKSGTKSFDCHDCDGTGRHTFTLDVAQRILESYGHYIETIKVHVVEVRSTNDENIHVWSASPLPQATARDMYAVRLAIHKETS